MLARKRFDFEFDPVDNDAMANNHIVAAQFNMEEESGAQVFDNGPRADFRDLLGNISQEVWGLWTPEEWERHITMYNTRKVWGLETYDARDSPSTYGFPVGNTNVIQRSGFHEGNMGV